MQSEKRTTPAAWDFNRPAYVVFLLAGIYFLIKKDFSQAVSFWGIALMFDPFDIKQAFKDRPAYQQIWLIVHLAITLALIVLMLIGK